MLAIAKMQSKSLHYALLTIVLLAIIISLCTGVPVPKKKPEGHKREKKPNPAADLLPEVSYRQYLAEVVSVLENDKEFSKRINNISKTEDLASQLEFVDHSVRSQLDEIKRKEVERLNALEKMLEAKEAAKGDPMREAAVPIHPEVFSMDQNTIKKAHLDHENPHTFEIADLKKLIKQVTDDLHKVDKAKEEQYKEYEMTKEHLRRKKLKKIKDPKKRAEAEREFEEAKKKHAQHDKVHEPGHKDQLKETWEKTDEMDGAAFNPRTFFSLHDLNGDGHLDVYEVEALFTKELEKVYNRTNDTTVNKFEMQHEMERMRQEMFDKVDTNRDMMIDLNEFLQWSNNPEFLKDDAWKTTEEADAPPFKDDEFKDFEDDYDRDHPDDDDDDDEDDIEGLHRFDNQHKEDRQPSSVEHHEQQQQQQHQQQQQQQPPQQQHQQQQQQQQHQQQQPPQQHHDQQQHEQHKQQPQHQQHQQQHEQKQQQQQQQQQQQHHA